MYTTSVRSGTRRACTKRLPAGLTHYAHVCVRACVRACVAGSETDVDCGGFCGATCGAKQKCASTKDCVAPRKCHKVKNICGAGGGLSKADPGDSCKQIKADEPQSKNGL